ncbi:hypothetical protein [Terracoccus sp. 273MFTsu3.1]|uniref:hypothetical protein n=1 Tax=Terracoccus sp. 273MFTsu3.1 TaxID=1172188 RepID=UPI0003743293|nr:hypothetical protein [Terracoccus sp. 273MFTsu3.1]
MSPISDAQVANAVRIGPYWVQTPPEVRPSDCTRVVLDSNVLIDTRTWFRGDSRNPAEVAELWEWIREVVRKGRGAIGDQWCLPLTSPALLELSWRHGEGGPVADEAAEYLSQVAAIAMWDRSTFRDRRGRAAVGRPVPVDKQRLANIRGELRRVDFDYLPEFVGDWASVLLLLPFLDRAAATKSVKVRSALAEEWRDLRALRGVGASAEVKMLAQYVFFGGAEQVIAEKRIHETALLKRSEWAKHGVGRVSRNVTFDLKMLRSYRETISRGKPGPGPQPTALVTRDGGLVALHSLIVAPLYTGEDLDIGTDEGWGMISRLPERSKLKEHWAAMSDERRTDQALKDAFAMKQLPPAQELIDQMPRWIDEVSRAVSVPA